MKEREREKKREREGKREREMLREYVNDVKAKSAPNPICQSSSPMYM